MVVKQSEGYYGNGQMTDGHLNHCDKTKQANIESGDSFVHADCLHIPKNISKGSQLYFQDIGLWFEIANCGAIWLPPN